MDRNSTPLNAETFFVTGATGYLGGYITRHLARNGAYLFCLKRKSSDISCLQDIEHKINWVCSETTDLNNFFQMQKIDSIVHCSTNYGKETNSPIVTVDANLILPLKLLHAAAGTNVRCFINFDTVLDKRVNHYSLSKKQFLDWCALYTEKIKFINIKLHHFFGPFDDLSKFTAFIIDSLLTQKDRVKLTSGEQKRDFIYIEDVIDAFVTIISVPADALPIGVSNFEVGTGTTVSIREFVELARNLSKNNSTILDFGALPERENEVYSPKSDIQKMIDIGWHPKHSLELGLIKCFKLHREQKCVA